jgi:hypothetical protein
VKFLLVCAGILASAGLLAAQSPAPQASTNAFGLSPKFTVTKVFNGNTISVTYSSPSVNGLAGKIFTADGLVGTGKNIPAARVPDNTFPIWRAGDGKATAFHTDADLDLGGLAVPKGDYTLYVDISNPDAWQLVVNKELNQWGLTYNKPNDLGRVKMNMSKPPALVENLKYTITDLGSSKGRIELAWENIVGSVDFTVK